MTPEEMNIAAVEPGLAFLHIIAPNIPDNYDVRGLIIATSGQESNYTARIQGGNGPAHGLYQFEKGTPQSRGGICGVMLHERSGPLLRQVCDKIDIPFDATAIWNYITAPAGDILATCLARLLYWTDMRPIPSAHDDDATYQYYLDNWRPGKPRAESWPTHMANARRVLDARGVPSFINAPVSLAPSLSAAYVPQASVSGAKKNYVNGYANKIIVGNGQIAIYTEKSVSRFGTCGDDVTIHTDHDAETVTLVFGD